MEPRARGGDCAAEPTGLVGVEDRSLPDMNQPP